MKTIRIGNGAGFWGDQLDAPRRLVETAGENGLDYLTLEYLAELTMSILAHLRSRDSNAGYVTDCPTVIESLLPALQSQNSLKIVTNAGGMNPEACVRRVSELLARHGLGGTRVAAVTGDDLLDRLDEFHQVGEEFLNLENGQPLGERRKDIVCANAYLGAGGIVDALAAGASVVITGRVADAALTVGPAMYEFGWAWTDETRLAAATVAGHLIECGAQVTGGMYSDWTPNVTLDDVGYPIAEIADNGNVVITKPPETGGAVTVGTVSEQLVYEIGDPAHYLTPEMDADFSHVRLEDAGVNRVRVSGAGGGPAPERYKVSMAYRDGYTATGMLVVVGPAARTNAQVCAETIQRRLQRAGGAPERMHVEILGSGDVVPGVLPTANPPEVVLRMSAWDATREKLERFSRELAPLVTSGPPGVTGYTGPRAKPRPVFRYWPTTVSRDHVPFNTTVRTAKEWTP